MNTDMTWETSTTDSETTVQLADAIGKQLKGGEVIELKSDLGGGKTTFVRGLAKGMGSDDHVASPTFTISREYHGPKLTLYHFDFYRLNDAGIVAHELAEYVGDPYAVVVVEWADIVHKVLPPEHFSITIQSTGENTRHISCTYPESLAYLIPNQGQKP